jgi:hypothetical protein
MTSYLIYPTEQEALDRSHRAHVGDTARKMKLSEDVVAKKMVAEEYVTLYRWATDVGNDGQTALVIDGDEQLLTQTELTKLVPKLPDGEGENWYKPPPEMPAA